MSWPHPGGVLSFRLVAVVSLICQASSAPPCTRSASGFSWPAVSFSPQLYSKLIICVIIVPALLPEVCVAVGDLRLLFCPVYTAVSSSRDRLVRKSLPSTGKSSNSSSSSNCVAGFFSGASGCSPFLESPTTAFFMSLLPCAEPDITNAFLGANRKYLVVAERMTMGLRGLVLRSVWWSCGSNAGDCPQSLARHHVPMEAGPRGAGIPVSQLGPGDDLIRGN